MALHTRIGIGLLLGIAVGALANLAALTHVQAALLAFQDLGTVFIRLITMVVIPLVFASLVIGAASLGDIRQLGRVGGRTIALYLGTTAIAVTIGLVVSQALQPGSRISADTRDQLSAAYAGEAAKKLEMAAEKPSLRDTLLEMIPTNPVAAASEGEMLPLIVFALAFGAAVSVLAEDRRRPVLAVFQGINDATMVLIDWIMRLAPYAVFALIAGVVSRFGFDLLRSLLIYCVCVVLGLVLHAFGTYAVLTRMLAGLGPVDFYRRIAQAPLVAFSTSSSNATLPVTMETAQERLGVSPRVASFVLPLGATINMDGTALYQAVAVMFIAQIYGIPMGPADQLTIVLTATLASVGTAGVPSAGIITLVRVLQSVGLGTQAQAGIAMILAVDRVLDMMRTAVNVTGDLACVACIARAEGETLTPPAAVSLGKPGTAASG